MTFKLISKEDRRRIFDLTIFSPICCDAPNFRGIFFFIQEFNVQLFYIPKIYETIFLQKCFSRPLPGLLRTHGLDGAPSSRVPERGVPRRGEQSPVVIISYKGYSPPKCTCNGCTENTHSSKMST